MMFTFRCQSDEQRSFFVMYLYPLWFCSDDKVRQDKVYQIFKSSKTRFYEAGIQNTFDKTSRYFDTFLPFTMNIYGWEAKCLPFFAWTDRTNFFSIFHFPRENSRHENTLSEYNNCLSGLLTLINSLSLINSKD